MVAHTPGPWRWETGSLETVVIVAPDGTRIGLAHWLNDDDDRSEQEANAAMFAAAPDLVTCLEELIALVEMDAEASDPTTDLWQAIHVGKATIDRAKGGGE